jgi:hypothetical protein
MTLIDLYLRPAEMAALMNAAEARDIPIEGEGGVFVAIAEVARQDATAGTFWHCLCTLRRARRLAELGAPVRRWKDAYLYMRRADGGPVHIFDRGGVTDLTAADIGGVDDPEDQEIGVVQAVTAAIKEK